MTRLIFLAITIFLLSIACKNENGNAAYEKSFNQKYPDAEDVKWEVDDHGFQEAKFELDDEDYRADFDAQGNWIETERSIDYDDLPAAVKKTIEEQYDEDDVEEVELVDHPTKGTFYDVELKDDGKKWDVEVAANGRIIGIDK